MSSIEMGRKALRYVGNTAKEVSGIGPAQRASMEGMSTSAHAIGLEKSKGGFSVIYGGPDGMFSAGWPLAFKLVRGKLMPYLEGFAIDTVVNIATVGLAFEGDVWAAAVVKLGYNTLVQIAPDVARLAKGKVFKTAR